MVFNKLIKFKFYIPSVFIFLLIAIPLIAIAGVKNTKHNLSVTGPGDIKALTETQICIFCHTPHNGSPAYPLWNHELSAVQNYINYWSSSLKAYSSETGAPPIDGFSKLCLSCHDGTVALGAVVANLYGKIQMVTIPNVVVSGKLRPGATGYLGTDLSGGHPLSFIFDEALVIRRNAEQDLMHHIWPINDPDVKIYHTQGGYGVQCTSCHDPHGGKGGPTAPPFWQKATHDEVCFVCHDILSSSYNESAHGDNSKLLKGCASCHKGHGVYNTPMLPEKKEVFCFRCHGNSTNIEETKSSGDLSSEVQLADIQKEFEKPYHHPIENIGIHEHNEILPEKDPTIPRHSECRDCHHQHYVSKDKKHAGIKGANQQGEVIDTIQSEYELCFKCHSYSANLPSDQTNKAELFDTTNPSFHPVIAPGKNSAVPSLLYPLTSSSTIKCTDCHNNNDTIGPKGPHGSLNKYILAKNFNSNDGAESFFQYELCYSCHVRTSILGNESFQLHGQHISIVGASCRTCHNPHGSLLYTHLIDFDSPFINPSSSGLLEYRDMGLRAGECFLSCHGKDHNPATYPTATPSLTPTFPSLKKPNRR
jgi:predicted CXXCH cytochrome family protein